MVQRKNAELMMILKLNYWFKSNVCKTNCPQQLFFTLTIMFEDGANFLKYRYCSGGLYFSKSVIFFLTEVTKLLNLLPIHEHILLLFPDFLPIILILADFFPIKKAGNIYTPAH